MTVRTAAMSDSKLYEVLGVSRGASDAEIRRVSGYNIILAS